MSSVHLTSAGEGSIPPGRSIENKSSDPSGRHSSVVSNSLSRISGLAGIGKRLMVAVMAIGLSASLFAQVPPLPEPPPEPAPEPPGPLDAVEVPLPDDLDEFVKDREAAILLGKSLFWDIQVGSDGMTSCASCHFNAGVDFGLSDRIRNTVAPNGAGFRGANKVLTSDDFPFHRLLDPASPRDLSPDGDANFNGIDDGDEEGVIFDTSEIVGSQGVDLRNFLLVNNPEDDGDRIYDPVFNVDGVNVRQVTGRNTPSTINAVFNDRNFWDGRADHFFNGVNPFGSNDPDAKVWVYDQGSLSQTSILLNKASAASQAVGPPLSHVEMSWSGRLFPQLGQKLIYMRPLQKQKVALTDSVLGRWVDRSGRGLEEGTDYEMLIQLAFYDKWWRGGDVGNGFTQMEENFALFWGLAIMMYESTLISDETPYDAYVKGDENAISADAKEGLRLFLNEGKCIDCHKGPLFTGATVDLRNPVDPNEGIIELMPMAVGPDQYYDNAFYNIGVRPTFEDPGVGGSGPFGPFSATRRRQLNLDVPGANDVVIAPGDDIAVDGAFKTPGLRNVELTGPYMHNGGMKSLEEVVEFYARGGDFPSTNIDDLDPDIQRLDGIIGNPLRIGQLVAFMKTLTDERVRYHRAPFDHPELPVPYGFEDVVDGVAIDDIDLIPAAGAKGYLTPMPTFVEKLEIGLVDDVIAVTPTSGLEISEDGQTAEFSMFLKEAPSAPVSIGIISTDPSEGQVSTGVLFFSPHDYDVPKTVTVYGLDDPYVDGIRAFEVRFAPSQSADPEFNGIVAPSVCLTNLDNDGGPNEWRNNGQISNLEPGVIVKPDTRLEVSEDGLTAEFTVALTAPPSAPVSIGISSGDLSEAQVSTSVVFFTSDNYFIPQTVTVFGLDDVIADGEQTFTINLADAFSFDPDYNGMFATSIDVINFDNEGGVPGGGTGGNTGGGFQNPHPADTNTDGVITSAEYTNHYLANPTADPAIIYSAANIVSAGGHYQVDLNESNPLLRWTPQNANIQTRLPEGIPGENNIFILINYFDKDGAHGLIKAADGTYQIMRSHNMVSWEVFREVNVKGYLGLFFDSENLGTDNCFYKAVRISDSPSAALSASF